MIYNLFIYLQYYGFIRDLIALGKQPKLLIKRFRFLNLSHGFRKRKLNKVILT
jgi:hypothetical protein